MAASSAAIVTKAAPPVKHEQGECGADSKRPRHSECRGLTYTPKASRLFDIAYRLTVL